LDKLYNILQKFVVEDQIIPCFPNCPESRAHLHTEKERGSQNVRLFYVTVSPLATESTERIEISSTAVYSLTTSDGPT